MLADLTSREPDRVHSAMWAVIALRDEAQLDALAAALPEIEQATAGLELGGIVYSNNRTLAFALRKLRYHRDREGCLCALYPELILFDPEKEAEAGHVRILQTTYIDGKWLDAYRCECTACGALFRVKYGEAHASWWEWSPAGRQEP